MQTNQTSRQPTSVLVVEDDPFALVGMTEYLQTTGYEVATATTLSGAITAVSERTYPLAIVDLAIPNNSSDNVATVDAGISLLTHLKEHAPETAVVVWSAYLAIHNNALVALLESGFTSVACIPKGSSLSTLDEAIQRVNNGQVFLADTTAHVTSIQSDQVLLKMLKSEQRTAVQFVASRLDSLSPQETKLVNHIYLNNKEVAATLGVRPRTVTNYLDSVYDKLGFRDSNHGLTRFDRRALIALAALYHRLQIEA